MKVRKGAAPKKRSLHH